MSFIPQTVAASLLAAHERVQSARSRFTTTGVIDRRSISATIAASWGRCRPDVPRLLQLDAPRAGASTLGSRLASTAQAPLERLAQELDDVSAGLVVADATGVIVAAAFCDARGRDALSAINMLPGYRYTEDAVGTNGIGTTLAQHRPVVVVGPEHIGDAFQEYACAGMPILDPISGSLIGVVEMTTRDTLDPQASRLMRHAVQRARTALERALLTTVTDHRKPLLQLFGDVEAAASGPVLAYSEGFEICNTWATLTLDVEDRAVLQRTALEMLALREAQPRRLTLHTGAECIVRPTLVMPTASTDAGVLLEITVTGSAAHVDLGFGHTPAVQLGASYRRFAEVRLLDGSSPLWLQARTDLGAALRRRESVLAVGETGTGKTSAIEEVFHQTRPDAQTMIVDPEDISQRVNRGKSLDALSAGAPGLLVLRNIHELTEQTSDALAEFLLSRPHQVQLAATYNPAAMSDRSPASILLPLFQHTTVIPPLRRRSRDIPGIIEQFLAVLAEDRAPLQLSPEALAALCAGSWPGNLSQLHDVLAALTAEHEPGTVIRTTDLPRFASTGGLRTLSLMESIERDAIVQTLYAHRRNKSAAAEALGISRSSLYRKMSRYGLDEL